MKKSWIVLLASALLMTTTMTACGDDSNDDNASDTNCQASVCSEDGSKLIECNIQTGETTESPCELGCDKTINECIKPSNDNNDNNDNKKCTASVCKDDGSALIECETASGMTTETPCPNGCNKETNQCNLPPKPECHVSCKDDKILYDCDANGVQSEKTCDGICADNACRDNNYCSNTSPCRDPEKNICNYASNTCDSLACSRAFCLTNETCVLGACVPESDINAEYNDICNVDTFVPHCRDNLLFECRYVSDNDDGSKIYKVRSSSCQGGCKAYESDGDVISTCVENMKQEDICGTTNVGSRCEESADQGWMTTYICVNSTNAEPIVVVSGFDMCDEGYGCYGNQCM